MNSSESGQYESSGSYPSDSSSYNESSDTPIIPSDESSWYPSSETNSSHESNQGSDSHEPSGSSEDSSSTPYESSDSSETSDSSEICSSSSGSDRDPIVLLYHEDDVDVDADAHNIQISAIIGFPLEWDSEGNVTVMLPVETGSLDWKIIEGENGSLATPSTEIKRNGRSGNTLTTTTVAGMEYRVRCELRGWKLGNEGKSYPPDHGPRRFTGKFKVICGKVASFDISVDKTEMPADATSRAEVTINNAKDQWGNIIDDERDVDWFLDGYAELVEGEVYNKLYNASARARVRASFLPEPCTITAKCENGASSINIEHEALIVSVETNSSELWVDYPLPSNDPNAPVAAPLHQTEVKVRVQTSDGTPVAEGTKVRVSATNGEIGSGFLSVDSNGEASTTLSAFGATPKDTHIIATAEASFGKSIVQFRSYTGFAVQKVYIGGPPYGGTQSFAIVQGGNPYLAGDITEPTVYSVETLTGADQVAIDETFITYWLYGPIGGRVKVRTNSLSIELNGLGQEVEVEFQPMSPPAPFPFPFPGIGCAQIIVAPRGRIGPPIPEDQLPEPFDIRVSKVGETQEVSVKGWVVPAELLAHLKSFVDGAILGEGEGGYGLAGEIIGGVILGTIADGRDVCVELGKLITGKKVDYPKLGFAIAGLVPWGRVIKILKPLRRLATVLQNLWRKLATKTREIFANWVKRALEAGAEALDDLLERIKNFLDHLNIFPDDVLNRLTHELDDATLVLAGRLGREIDPALLDDLARTIAREGPEASNLYKKAIEALGRNFDNIGKDLVEDILRNPMAREGLVKTLKKVEAETVNELLDVGNNVSILFRIGSTTYPPHELMRRLGAVSEVKGFASLVRYMKQAPLKTGMNPGRARRYELDVAIREMEEFGETITEFSYIIRKGKNGYKTDVDVVTKSGKYIQAKNYAKLDSWESQTKFVRWSQRVNVEGVPPAKIQWVTTQPPPPYFGDVNKNFFPENPLPDPQQFPFIEP